MPCRRFTLLLLFSSVLINSQLLSGIPLSKSKGRYGGVFLFLSFSRGWIELPPYRDGLEAPHLPTPPSSVREACLRPATMRLSLHQLWRNIHFLKVYLHISYSFSLLSPTPYLPAFHFSHLKICNIGIWGNYFSFDYHCKFPWNLVLEFCPIF